MGDIGESFDKISSKLSSLIQAARYVFNGIGSVGDTMIEYIKARNDYSATEGFIENENIFKRYILGKVRPMYVPNLNKQMVASATYFANIAYGIYMDGFNERICDPQGYPVHLRSLQYNRTSLFQRPRFGIYFDKTVPCLVVAVRGTSGTADTFTDIDMSAGVPKDEDVSEIWEQTYTNPQFVGTRWSAEKMEKFKEYVTACKFHTGFFQSAINIMFCSGFNMLKLIDEVYEELRQHHEDEMSPSNDLPIYCTGHSLGASTAGTIACLLRMFGFNSYGVLFAPAPFVSPTVNTAMNASQYIFAMVNRWDIVPRLEPTVIRNAMQVSQTIMDFKVRGIPMRYHGDIALDEPQLIIPGNVWWMLHDDVSSQKGKVENWGLYYLKDRSILSVAIIPQDVATVGSDHSMTQYLGGLRDLLAHVPFTTDYLGLRAFDSLFLRPDLTRNDIAVQLVAGDLNGQRILTQRHLEIQAAIENNDNEDIERLQPTDAETREITEAVFAKLDAMGAPTNNLKDTISSTTINNNNAISVSDVVVSPSVSKYIDIIRVSTMGHPAEKLSLEILDIMKTLNTCLSTYYKRIAAAANDEAKRYRIVNWLQKKIAGAKLQAGFMGAVAECLWSLTKYSMTEGMMGMLIIPKTFWNLLTTVIQFVTYVVVDVVARQHNAYKSIRDFIVKLRQGFTLAEFGIIGMVASSLIVLGAISFVYFFPPIAAVILPTFGAVGYLWFYVSVVNMTSMFYKMYCNFSECVAKCGDIKSVCYNRCFSSDQTSDDLRTMIYYYPRITKKILKTLGSSSQQMAASLMIHPSLMAYDFKDVDVWYGDENTNGLRTSCGTARRTLQRRPGFAKAPEEGKIKLLWNIVVDLNNGRVRNIKIGVLSKLSFKKIDYVKQIEESKKRERLTYPEEKDEYQKYLSSMPPEERQEQLEIHKIRLREFADESARKKMREDKMKIQEAKELEERTTREWKEELARSKR